MKLLEMICEELGVEIGEEWIGNNGRFYSIDKNGKLTNYAYKEDGRKSYTDWIERVLVGELKPVWEPKEGEIYFTPEVDNYLKFSRHTWLNREIDILLYKRGLVFKTKEEAVACAEKMLKAIKDV